MKKIMCHVVAGYPSEKQCIELLLGMQKAGIGLIEVQIPFSDPIADGETIMIANDKALENGMTTQKSFTLIKTSRESGLKADIYVMSYTQKLLSFGLDNFCKQAKSSGVKGLIIPDLPPEAEEYKALCKLASKYGLEIVPVVSPGADENRLQASLKNVGTLIYLTSIKGITGNKLKLSDQLKETAQYIKKQRPDCKLALGFGIENAADAKEILNFADVAVIGSSVIRQVNKDGVASALKFIKNLVN